MGTFSRTQIAFPVSFDAQKLINKTVFVYCKKGISKNLYAINSLFRLTLGLPITILQITSHLFNTGFKQMTLLVLTLKDYVELRSLF